MGEYLHPYIELGTFRVYTCMYTMVMDASTRRWTLTLPKFDEPLSPRFHFKKEKNWELLSVNVRVILLVEGDTMGEYLHPHIELETLRVSTCTYMMVTAYQQGDGLSHYQNSMSLSVPGSILKNFRGTDVSRCEGHTLS